MELSKEQITLVEELSGLYFELPQIAIVLQLDIAEFLTANGYNESRIRKALQEAPKTPIALSIAKGRLQKEYEIRKAIFEAAEQGSSPAQAQVLRIMDRKRISDQLLKK